MVKLQFKTCLLLLKDVKSCGWLWIFTGIKTNPNETEIFSLLQSQTKPSTNGHQSIDPILCWLNVYFGVKSPSVLVGLMTSQFLLAKKTNVHLRNPQELLSCFTKKRTGWILIFHPISGLPQSETPNVCKSSQATGRIPADELIVWINPYQYHQHHKHQHNMGEIPHFFGLKSSNFGEIFRPQ